MAYDPACNHQVINIGPDDEFVTINELARTIADLLRFDLQPTYVQGRPQEVHLANCSAGKIRRRFGYSTRYSLRDGLAEMIEWIRRRGPKPFKYHLDLEIVNELTPRTWRERMF
jgi:UDP-glucose 4-epimerase